MKREIKFRGLTPEGKWVYGDLINSFEGTHIVESSYFKPSNDEPADLTDIDSRTAGQITGLKDKNGNDIYEGDILSCPFGTHSDYSKNRKEKTFNLPIVFESGEFKFKMCKSGNYRFYPDIELDCKIIGNIHQHPNLLS